MTHCDGKLYYCSDWEGIRRIKKDLGQYSYISSDGNKLFCTSNTGTVTCCDIHNTFLLDLKSDIPPLLNFHPVISSLCFQIFHQPQTRNPGYRRQHPAGSVKVECWESTFAEYNFHYKTTRMTLNDSNGNFIRIVHALNPSEGSFHQSLVAIGPVVSEEKIFM
jgi:hypothetical protein